MKFEFEPTFGEMYWAALIIISRRPFHLAVSLFFPLSGLAVVVLTIWSGQPITAEILLLFAACCAFTPGITALNVWLFRRKNRTVRGIHEFLLDDRGIHVSGATYDFHLKWGAIIRVVETKRYFFFLYSSLAAQFLPKRVIPSSDSLQEVRSIIAANFRSE